MTIGFGILRRWDNWFKIPPSVNNYDVLISDIDHYYSPVLSYDICFALCMDDILLVNYSQETSYSNNFQGQFFSTNRSTMRKKIYYTATIRIILQYNVLCYEWYCHICYINCSSKSRRIVAYFYVLYAIHIIFSLVQIHLNVMRQGGQEPFDYFYIKLCESLSSLNCNLYIPHSLMWRLGSKYRLQMHLQNQTLSMRRHCLHMSF